MSAPDSDVVVVGSGGAGMMAALRAAVGGAQVTVLEVSDLFGGTTAISGGGMWLPRTRLAAEAGIEDSRDEVKRYLTYLTSGVTDEAVIDRFIDTAPAVIDFIEEHTALRFYVDCERPDYKTTFPGAADAGRLVAPKLYQLSRLGELRARLRQPDWEARTRPGADGRGMEAITQQEMQHFAESNDPMGWVELSRQRVADGVVPRGCALIGAMLEVVAARGARLFTSARALELTTDRGRVTGVVADVAGERRTFRATAGVVLAAGGFEWHEDLWRGLVRVPGVVRMSPPDNRGDALRMAQRAGARLALLDQVWWSITAGGQPGQLVVNRSGRRFMNECITYNDYGKILGYFDPHTYQFPNIPAYVISSRPLEPADASAPTLRELGEAIGVDAASLEATAAEFDKHAELGHDPAFGRGVAGWDRWRKLDKTLANPALAPLGSTGPFYAQRVVARCFGTKGGPVIDQAARIVDFDGAPIPGLYGAGNSVAAPFGLAYPGGGGTLAPAVTFGYVAGQSLTGG
ncbi:MAG TPA: FAD-dependent oxidoreductase [Streptosporangiaceae bacterium]|nr:FAD-dependent oxidoreductase [Streptosporangiaceae bacterium]